MRADAGTATPLIAGAVLIAGLVITATVAASAVFLAHRDLAGFCDGAAAAATAAATTSDATGDPAVDPTRMAAAIEDYEEDGTQIDATTDGRTVEVACTRTVRIPFGAVVGAPDGLVRTVVARARPVTR